MDIHKAIGTALKVISENQPEVKKYYKLQRTLAKVGRLHLYRPNFTAADFLVVCRQHVVPIRMHYPQKDWAGKAVIIFLHGGGWVTGDIDSYTRVCATLAKQTGCRVAAVDYRLAPEHTFPAGFEDCYEVSRYLYQNSYYLFGIPPKKIILAGDSAGGNLAAAVSLKARDTADFTPNKQILLYPVVYNDHTSASPYESVQTNGKDYILTAERIQEYMDLYAGGCDRTQPYFAPLLAGDFSRQPDTLVITAQYDPLCDEGEAYAAKLAGAGIYTKVHRIQDALHGFFSMPAGVPAVQEAYGYIKEFLKEEVAAD